MNNGLTISKKELTLLKKLAKNQSIMITGDAVMFSQIPSPTFQTDRKAKILIDKFSLLNLDEVKIDSFGNVTAVLLGDKNMPKLMIAAHLDTVFSMDTDYMAHIETDRIVGPSIADNSLGLAALISLAQLLKRDDSFTHGDIMFACTTGAENDGALAGMRGLIMNYKDHIENVLCLEGLHLGMVVNKSQYRNIIRIKIKCDLIASADKKNKQQSGKNQNAIYFANMLLNKIYSINLKNEPDTQLIIQNIKSDNTIHQQPDYVEIILNIESANSQSVNNIFSAIDFFAKHISSNNPCKIYLQNHSVTPGGNISTGARIIKIIKAIHSELDIKTNFVSASSDVAIPISLDIPAITIGLADGGGKHTLKEYIETETIEKGFLQVLLFIHQLYNFVEKRGTDK